jgi:hypothetical protein
MPYRDLNKRRSYFRKEHKRKLEILNTFKDKPCMDCGGSFPPECMDFDHRPGEVKVLQVSLMARYNLDKMLAEIAKCDLICSNCHRIRTKNRIILK